MQKHLSAGCRLCSTRFLWMKYMEIKQLKILVRKALNLKAIFRAHSISYCVRTGEKIKQNPKPNKKNPKKQLRRICSKHMPCQKDSSAISWIFLSQCKRLMPLWNWGHLKNAKINMLQFPCSDWVIRYYHILNDSQNLAGVRTLENTLNKGKFCYCTHLKVACL